MAHLQNVLAIQQFLLEVFQQLLHLAVVVDQPTPEIDLQVVDLAVDQNPLDTLQMDRLFNQINH
jgi:hypothetical protein